MFDWLFEGQLTVYLLIGVLALILLGMWTRNRRSGWLIAALTVALLLPLYLLLDRLVETRREQIGRKLEAMAAAVKKKDAGTIFGHISESFNWGGLNKAAFRGYVDRAMQGVVSDLKVWDFHFPDDSGKVEFFAKPESPYTRDMYFLVKAEFVRDSDGQWRLKGFDVFNPLVNTTTPISVPGLPSR